MEREIKERLEEVVTLLNDTDDAINVGEKEIKEKVERILALLNDPKEIEGAREDLHDRLGQVIELVSKSMVDPDIEQFQTAISMPILTS